MKEIYLSNLWDFLVEITHISWQKYLKDLHGDSFLFKVVFVSKYKVKLLSSTNITVIAKN